MSVVKFEIQLTSEAEQDLAEIYAWYLGKSELVAERFSSEAIATIDSLVYFPFRFSVRFNNYRSVSVHKFPYYVFYRILDNQVQIAKIWHHKRDLRGLEFFE